MNPFCLLQRQTPCPLMYSTRMRVHSRKPEETKFSANKEKVRGRRHALWSTPPYVFCSFTEVRRGRILIKQGQDWLMKIYVAQVCRALALKTNAALWWTAEDRHYWHSMITYKGNLILALLLGYEVLTSYILGHDIMWLPFWTIPREF